MIKKSFNKIVNEKIEEHILDFFNVEDLKAEARNRIDNKNIFNIYQAISQMVQDGCFLCYYEDVRKTLKDWLDNLYNDNFSNPKSWEFYKNKIAIIGSRLIDKFNKDLQKILEKCNFTLKEYEDYFNIQQCTPMGEDWNMDFENLNELIAYAEGFDPEEEFNMWRNATVKGVPSTPELWKDQLFKQKVLNKLLKGLNKIRSKYEF